jgi:hypothetical protein
MNTFSRSYPHDAQRQLLSNKLFAKSINGPWEKPRCLVVSAAACSMTLSSLIELVGQ